MPDIPPNPAQAVVPPPPRERGKKQTLTMGVAYAVAIFIVTLLVMSIVAIVNVYTVIASILFVVPYFFLGGLVKIPTGHKGVEKFLGERRRGHILKEGDNWTFPRPIGEVQTVDTRVQSVTLPEFNVETVKIPPEGSNPTDPQQEEESVVMMRAGITLQYRVVNPIIFLDVARSVVQEGMSAVAISVMRQQAIGKSDIDYLGKQEEIKDSVRRAVDDVTAAWGIDIQNLTLQKVLHANPDIIAAYEERAKEKAQSPAEGIEARTLASGAKFLATELGISREKAAVYFQAERGKRTINQVVVERPDGRPVSDPEAAAAIYSQAHNPPPPSVINNQEQEEEEE